MIGLMLFSKSLRQSLQRRWLLITALIALIVFSSGCENQMSTQRGVISGLVLDDSGNRITGAMVTSHRSLFKAETDENGYYEFTSLDVGSHRLTVERNGFYLASKTVELGYGEVMGGIDIIVENLPDLIQWKLSVREKNRVVVDVECAESMSVIAAWRQVGGARLQTAPTQTGLLHQIELTGLFPGAEYMVEIEGITPDGRKFVSESGNFKTLHPLDLAGAPEVPQDFKVIQSTEGPRLSWNYSGSDPVEGFRIYRSVDADEFKLLFDESYVFGSQTSLADDNTEPGRLFRYSIQSVDYEGNVSSLTTPVDIVPSGKIEQDLVWGTNLSPIRLSGDITVPQGRTLRIEAGVNLVFNDVDEGRTGYKPESCEFIIEGRLIAQGTPENPIRMISGSAAPARNDWDGLRIIAGASQEGTLIDYLEIAGAEKGLALYSSQSQISNVVARFCQTGISLNGLTSFNLNSVNFNDCDNGLYIENSLDCSVSNLNADSVNYGIVLLANKNLQLRSVEVRNARKTALKTGDRFGLKVRNAILHAYDVGIDAGGGNADYQYVTVDAPSGIVVNGADVPTIKNSIIYNGQIPGSGYGIEDKTPGRSYPYNIIFNYAQATFNCDQNGGPIQNLDPMFVGQSPFNYQLKAGSPALTASERGGQIGAYGSDI